MSIDARWNDGAGLRWLFLDLNSYFASVEQQVNPGLRGKPVIVTPVPSEYTSAIAASYEAKAFGIRTGTSVREARRLCPAVRVVSGRHDLYVEFHHRIVEEIESHLHVTQVCSIDEVACELMGPERLTGNAVRLAEEVQQGILDRVGSCLGSSVGLAPSRLLAKTASKMKKPRGLTVLPADGLPGPLLGLKLRDLTGVAANMERRLHAAGIGSVEALWNASPARARAAWGSVEGERFWRALHGEDPPEIPTLRRSVSHSQILAPELRAPPRARLVARRLLAKAAARLRRMERRAGALVVSVRSVGGFRGVAERIFPPTGDTFALLRALDEAWAEATMDCRAEALKKVGVTLHRLAAEAACAAPDLFDGLERAGPAACRNGLELSRALDRLSRRFGRDTVSIGPKLSRLSPYTGAKIAFNRIPDRADFLE